MRKSLLVSAAVAALVGGCAPRVAYVGPITSFSTQAEKLNKATTDELTRFATDQRAAYLRNSVVARIVYQVNPNPNGAPFAFVSFADFTCKPLKVAAGHADRVRYLGAVAEALKETSAPPSDKVGDLLRALGESYAINVPLPTSESGEERCRKDVEEFLSYAYPENTPEFSPTAIVAGIKGLKAVFEELAPLVLTQIDEAKRASALQAFLSNEENLRALKDTVSRDVKFLSEATKQRRLIALNSVDRAYDAYARKLAGVDLSKIPVCAAYIKNPKTDASPTGGVSTSGRFRDCYSEIWQGVSSEGTKLAAVAAAYDVEASKKPEKVEELNKVIDKLAATAAGNLDAQQTAAMFSAFAETAVALESFSDKFSSDETKKKVDEALEQIAKGF